MDGSETQEWLGQHWGTQILENNNSHNELSTGIEHRTLRFLVLCCLVCQASLGPRDYFHPRWGNWCPVKSNSYCNLSRLVWLRAQVLSYHPAWLLVVVFQVFSSPRMWHMLLPPMLEAHRLGFHPLTLQCANCPKRTVAEFLITHFQAK